LIHEIHTQFVLTVLGNLKTVVLALFHISEKFTFLEFLTIWINLWWQMKNINVYIFYLPITLQEVLSLASVKPSWQEQSNEPLLLTQSWEHAPKTRHSFISEHFSSFLPETWNPGGQKQEKPLRFISFGSGMQSCVQVWFLHGTSVMKNGKCTYAYYRMPPIW